MKRNLFLASAAIAVLLTSCTKDSELDSSIVSVASTQSEIGFSTYASSSTTATKGTAVNTNNQFQSSSMGYGSFNVSALVSSVTTDVAPGDSSVTVVAGLTFDGTTDASKIEDYDLTPVDGAAVTYFGFNTVKYTDGDWVNQSQMYWPNYSRVMHFAAYSPYDAAISSESFSFTTDDVSDGVSDGYTFSFDYTVSDTSSEQVDLMYALTQEDYLAPSDQVNYNGESYITTGADSTTLLGDTNEEDDVNLHFKHALTQIAFTATKSDDIDIYVKSVTICNVYNSGTFTAKEITDDKDTSNYADKTVGNTAAAGDQVDADNFGEWDDAFDIDGWGDTQVASADGDGDYYTVTDDTNTFYYATTQSKGNSYMSHYEAPLADNNALSPTGTGDNNSIMIAAGTTATQLTSTSDVLMLKPQKLTAWIPTASTVLNCIGYHEEDSTKTIEDITYFYNGTQYSCSSATASVSYLAIDCEIYHAGIDNSAAMIHDGYIFIPFETKDIKYSEASVDDAVSDADEWLPGYKITYCLNFGGGYVVEEGHTSEIPVPGCIPDTDTYTLRTLTYSTTVDSWVDVATDTLDLEEFLN